MLSQSAPPACPSGHPVDDIISEIHKQQSKRKHRNPNPIPDAICIGGWCRGRSQKPPKAPEPAPRPEAPSNGDSSSTSTSSSSTSSSRTPVDKCDEAMERALEAAHNVEVGDYEFESKNYKGALFRYKDADEEKPGDAAIHVRLGRVFEQLGQLPEATGEYKAAQELAGPQKWLDEAKDALVRLQTAPFTLSDPGKSPNLSSPLQASSLCYGDSSRSSGFQKNMLILAIAHIKKACEIVFAHGRRAPLKKPICDLFVSLHQDSETVYINDQTGQSHSKLSPTRKHLIASGLLVAVRGARCTGTFSAERREPGIMRRGYQSD